MPFTCLKRHITIVKRDTSRVLLSKETHHFSKGPFSIMTCLSSLRVTLRSSHVCLCVYVCIYTRTHKYTCTHSHTRAHTHTHKHTHKQTHKQRNTCTHTFTYMLCVRVCVCV